MLAINNIDFTDIFNYQQDPWLQRYIKKMTQLSGICFSLNIGPKFEK